MSCAKVGLGFPGLGARSPWPPSGSAPPLPASSPTHKTQFLSSLEGMFSLLVSAPSGVILFPSGKRGREGVLNLTPSAPFISLTLGKIFLETKNQGHRSLLINLYLLNCLVSLLIPFSFYLLSTVLLTCSDVTRCASLNHVSAINQTRANLHQQGLDSSHHDPRCYGCPMSRWTRLHHGGKLRLFGVKTPTVAESW